MQRNLIIILLVTIAPFLVQAQNGSGLLNKIKNKVNNRVDKKIDGEIDKTLDQLKAKNKQQRTIQKQVKHHQLTMVYSHSPNTISFPANRLFTVMILLQMPWANCLWAGTVTVQALL